MGRTRRRFKGSKFIPLTRKNNHAISKSGLYQESRSVPKEWLLSRKKRMSESPGRKFISFPLACWQSEEEKT